MVLTVPDRTSTAERPARHTSVRVDESADGWTLEATDAVDGARARKAFRDFLEREADPACDLDAAEAVFGELVNSCVRHAPGPIRVEFRWDAATLMVCDAHDRLYHWPFAVDDMRAEATHHAHALIDALTLNVHLSREPSGGTRARVALPVTRAGS